MTRDHRKEIEIDATADEVWRAITDGDELTRWYADRARVTPGEGGSVTAGWEAEDGSISEGISVIDVWEPGRRLRLIDQQPEGVPVKERPTVQEWTIEAAAPETGGGDDAAAGSKTVLRLVHSGFPEDDEWDAIYDSMGYGWETFLYNLRHYLERHPGEPRRAVIATGSMDLDRSAAWNGLVGAFGLAGGRYETELPSGEKLSGTVLLEREGEALLASVDQLDDGLLFVTLEIGAIWASLAAYGAARSRLDGLGEHWRDWMLQAPGR